MKKNSGPSWLARVACGDEPPDGGGTAEQARQAGWLCRRHKAGRVGTTGSWPVFLRLSISFQNYRDQSDEHPPDQADFKCILLLMIITLEGSHKIPVGDPSAKACS